MIDEDTAHDTIDEIEVLPWWHSKLNVVVLVLAAAVLAGAIGWLIGSRDDDPGAGSVDVGFLQDMRMHHEQAVQMASIYLSQAPDGDPGLRQVARTIQFGQAIEIGRMIQMLRGFDAAEANQTDTAMTWMGQPTPIDRMPGMASDDDIARLTNARGAEADQLFVDLMTAHHEGGIVMADDAVDRASDSEVRAFAESMASGQRGEIAEMQGLLTASQS